MSNIYYALRFTCQFKQVCWVQKAFLNLSNSFLRNASVFWPNRLYIILSNSFDSKGRTMTGSKLIFLLHHLSYVHWHLHFSKVLERHPSIRALFRQLVSSSKQMRFLLSAVLCREYIWLLLLSLIWWQV